MFQYQPTTVRNVDSYSKIYPRPSPYIESNLHKFGVGPSASLVPVLNELPVHQKKLQLSSAQYYQKDIEKSSKCYCCFGEISHDFIQNTEKYFLHSEQEEQQQKSIKTPNLRNTTLLAENQNQQSQSTLLGFLKIENSNKQSQKQEMMAEQRKLKIPACCQCQKMVCQKCFRYCKKCREIVCKFDFKEDNSLGRHNCTS